MSLCILRDLSFEQLIYYSLELTAALIALFVFKETKLHRNIIGMCQVIKATGNHRGSYPHSKSNYIFPDDRRLIKASPFNLSRGLARPFADLIKQIVRGSGVKNPAEKTLRTMDLVFPEYLAKERISPENAIPDKLFIVFPESEEEVCTVDDKLKKIERNEPNQDGKREMFSISVNPIIQPHRDPSSGFITRYELHLNKLFNIILGNLFQIKIEVLKIRRHLEGCGRENLYIFFFENRPLRTLYRMKDDSRIKFEKQDLDYHFQLYYESLKEMLEESEEVNRAVKLIKFKYKERSLKFTDDLIAGISSYQSIEK